MAMMQTQRERFLMGVTALAVVFGGGYLLAFRPVMSKYTDLNDRIVALQKDLAKTKEQNVRSQQYRAEFERIKASLSIEGTEQDKKTRINEELTKLLSECGITYNSLTENPEERIDDDFKIYSFSLKGINTDWATLATFLYQVEINPAVLEVKSMSIRRKAGAGVTSPNLVQADVEISRTIEHKIAARKKKK